jgi:mono/diheme cytochrome c family protein
MRQLALAVSPVLLMLLMGCKVSAPGKAESSLIQWTKHNITVGNKKGKNPVSDTKENFEAGKEAFSHYCLACHGMDGQNTGVPFAGQISPPIPLLNSKEVQSYSDGQLKWVLDNGVAPSGMPSSKGILSDDELWSIVIFLRHLPPAGSLGDPPMYDK